MTIPCVTGPYTGVNATLTLSGAMVRTQPPGSAYQPRMRHRGATTTHRSSSRRWPRPGTATIATSNGQNDAGLFDVNLRDERWLPFEGQGAISAWNLVLDPRDNNFDFTTITDVVLHVRYTARGGGDQTAANNVRNALKPLGPRSIYLSTRSTFSGAYYAFLNPAASNATAQTLTLPLTDAIFPFSNLGGGVKITSVAFFVALNVPAAGNTIAATYSIDNSAPASVSLAPAPGQTSAGNPIDALTALISIAALAPQRVALTIADSALPAALTTVINGQTRLDPAVIEDVLLVVEYLIQ